MSLRIAVLSGPVGAGKSTLAERLATRPATVHLRTRELMAHVAQERRTTLPMERAALQAFGEQLDTATDGRWVVDGLAPKLSSLPPDVLVIIDAIRIPQQLAALRDAFGRNVVHLHLDAPREILGSRYETRRGQSAVAELANYEAVAANATEAAVGRLRDDADAVIDTDRNRPEDVEIRAAARLGLLPTLDDRLVDVLVGGEHGSEGKGNVAFYLAPEYDVLVRVGGPNAGHIVPLDPPYTHSQLPSGTRANEQANLVLGAGTVLRLDQLQQEIADCVVEADRLVVDPQAMVIEQEDISAEEALKGPIGSTGRGVGQATARRILGRGDSATGKAPVRLARDVPELLPFTSRRAIDVLSEAFSRGHRVLLEGTQGTGLSLYHGTYPYVTSRDTTVAGCLAEAGIAPHRVNRVILVVRTYPIRVGGQSGPMAQEIDWATVADRAGLDIDRLREVEKGSISGNPRRVSEFDWVLLRQAAEINGATDVALTFADYFDAINKDARRFDQLSRATLELIDEIQRVAGAEVTLVSTRFHERSVLDRRRWRQDRR